MFDLFQNLTRDLRTSRTQYTQYEWNLLPINLKITKRDIYRSDFTDIEWSNLPFRNRIRIRGVNSQDFTDDEQIVLCVKDTFYNSTLNSAPDDYRPRPNPLWEYFPPYIEITKEDGSKAMVRTPIAVKPKFVTEIVNEEQRERLFTKALNGFVFFIDNVDRLS